MLGAVLVAAAYAAGTFPTAQLVGRWAGHDPSAAGSGNPGATNVYRLAGRKAGGVVLAGDVLKGAVPTGAALVATDRRWASACAVASVLGHVFPVQRRGRGGKGVATAGGAMVTLHPGLAVVLLVVWVAIARLLGRPSVASLVAAVGLPAGVALGKRPLWETMVSAGLSALVIARHKANIQRLLAGEETTLR